MLLQELVPETPICVITWMTEMQKAAMQRRLAEVINEEGHDAYITQFDVSTKEEMLARLDEWKRDNSNTQHLVFISHGIQIEDTDEWLGIGLSGAPEESIDWDELWDVVVATDDAPPSVSLLGCRTTAAINAWSGKLFPNVEDNPYVIGLSEIVEGITLRRAVRSLLGVLVRTSTQMPPDVVYLDEAVEQMKEVCDIAELYYPAPLPETGKLAYIEADDFQTVYGLSFTDYLKRAGSVSGSTEGEA